MKKLIACLALSLAIGAYGVEKKDGNGSPKGLSVPKWLNKELHLDVKCPIHHMYTDFQKAKEQDLKKILSFNEKKAKEAIAQLNFFYKDFDTICKQLKSQAKRHDFHEKQICELAQFTTALKQYKRDTDEMKSSVLVEKNSRYTWFGCISSNLVKLHVTP